MVQKVIYSLLEALAIKARARARRLASRRADSTLKILHYTEWKKYFSQAYLEEIEKVQKGEN